MPKIFITGSAGTGKSTVLAELAHRGYATYDTDEIPGATDLVYQKTGAHAEWPRGMGAMDWETTYAWNWQEPKISELLGSNETVIIGAVVGNWREYADQFNQIIVLSVNENEQEKRLFARNTHEHGNQPDEIAARVTGQRKMRERFITAGAIVVENNGDIIQTANEIEHVIRNNH